MSRPLALATVVLLAALPACSRPVGHNIELPAASTTTTVGMDTSDTEPDTNEGAPRPGEGLPGSETVDAAHRSAAQQLASQLATAAHSHHLLEGTMDGFSATPAVADPRLVVLDDTYADIVVTPGTCIRVMFPEGTTTEVSC